MEGKREYILKTSKGNQVVLMTEKSAEAFADFIKKGLTFEEVIAEASPTLAKILQSKNKTLVFENNVNPKAKNFISISLKDILFFGLADEEETPFELDFLKLQEEAMKNPKASKEAEKIIEKLLKKS